MLQIPPVEGKMFLTPTLFFTMVDQPHSCKVVEEMKSNANDKGLSDQEYVVFQSLDDVQKALSNGHPPNKAVALFDSELRDKNFGMLGGGSRKASNLMPQWSCGAAWGVLVSSKCSTVNGRVRTCALQVMADFGRNFLSHISSGWFPWGRPSKNEVGPRQVQLPQNIDDIIAGLNNGPDLAASIADQSFALELPAGSRISWIRIPGQAISCDNDYLDRALDALRKFEKTCGQVVRNNKDIAELLLAGVTLKKDSPLAHAYLNPPAPNFSVGRPDLHYTGTGLFASEIDEMPGGWPQLVHQDSVYGVNQGNWTWAFDWLTAKGLVVFVVSHKWSECYIPETQWLMDYLQQRGYPAFMVTTDKMDDLYCEADGVYYRGDKVGTIWRQFPIFETEGLLEELVMASCQGLVRMVPEFAHFGNKAWFSVFRSHRGLFQPLIESSVISLLDQLLPDSHLILPGENDFLCSVAGIQIYGLSDLRKLSAEQRNKLVLKVCGANDLAARSYGVLMGINLTQDTWNDWIDDRARLKQPFIVQHCLETGVVDIAVKNTKTNMPEAFRCRVMLRPWSVGDQLVSVSAVAVPSSTKRVHGMVDMALLPVVVGKI